MRVLLLRRRGFGGIATHSESLLRGLIERGISCEVLTAAHEIPNETGGKTDREVSKWLRKRAEGFDLVHAFEYRAAWACAEAFGYEEAWVYTAYGMPKTVHRMLVDRLNRSQAGICSSHAVMTELDRALALDLSVIHPGVPTSLQGPPSRAEARQKLGLDSSSPIVVGMGRFVPERGFANLIQAMEDVWTHLGEAELVLAGGGPEEQTLRERAAALSKPGRVRFLGIVEDPGTVLASADLVVVPSTRAGFSMVAIEAMSLSVPVLVRNSGGLMEIVDPEISGFLFHADEELGSRIAELLAMPVSLESVGNAGRLRVWERFTLDQCVEGVIELYRSICQDVI